MKLQHISAIPFLIRDKLEGLKGPVLFCFGSGEQLDAFKKALGSAGIRFFSDYYDSAGECGVFVKHVKDARKDVVISDTFMKIKVGQKMRPCELLDFLLENGYKRVPQEPYSEGEFSLVGDVFEIRLKGFKIRVEFLFDEVERIYILNSRVERRDEISIPSFSRKSVRRFWDIFDEVICLCCSGVCEEHSRGTIRDFVSEISRRDILSPFDHIRGKDDVLGIVAKGYDVVIAVRFSYEEETAKEFFGKAVKVMRVDDYPFGFIDLEGKKALIPFEVFYGRRKRIGAPQSFPEISYDELKEGTYVVHKVHGIGIFRGTSIERGREFLKIEYRDSAFLYIPAEDIVLIRRYVGMENPPLDELGGRTYALRLARVRQYVEKHISDFMRVLAIRRSLYRPPYVGADDVLARVEETFPYEETSDQRKAIDEVISALCGREYPVDFLVVGDSGVGKTEVAIRAMCVVAYAGKQVAFICPTTVLALQHYMRIKNRLSELPFKIAMLSRLTPFKKQKEILEEIRTGNVDIVIGTHKVINVLPYFRELGLLILDEEHRFGVEQKEKISRIRATCDVLSLSATPIPRTLKMALSGLKDIALIRTKPAGRGNIITSFIGEDKIRDVIDFELRRDGQVVYITPFIEGQTETLLKIHRMFPGVPISVLHGKMRPSEIERILILFMIGKIKILVATKIISLGVDIPNVNVMVIERADLFGLSELYQLRGRVGRGDRDAFCYLVVPKDIGKDARNRLEIFIETVNFRESGVGFHLALKDLEMRGAGNLFGPEQIGHIHAIGFDAYIEILREVISEMREKATRRTSFEPVVKVDVPAYIPAEIIPDRMLRISLYRAFAMAESLEEVEEVYKMIKYRFIGDEVPQELENFVKISRLKVLMRNMNIYSATFSSDLTVVELETKDGRIRLSVQDMDDLIRMLMKVDSNEDVR